MTVPLDSRRTRILESLQVISDAYDVDVPDADSPTFKTDALVVLAEAVAALATELKARRAPPRPRRRR